jgi:hypothetical protein
MSQGSAPRSRKARTQKELNKSQLRQKHVEFWVARLLRTADYYYSVVCQEASPDNNKEIEKAAAMLKASAAVVGALRLQENITDGGRTYAKTDKPEDR